MLAPVRDVFLSANHGVGVSPTFAGGIDKAHPLDIVLDSLVDKKMSKRFTLGGNDRKRGVKLDYHCLVPVIPVYRFNIIFGTLSVPSFQSL